MYENTLPVWFVDFVLWLILAIFVVLGALYLVAAIRSRGKPKVERKGIFFGGDCGFHSRCSSGIANGAAPGAFLLFGREKDKSQAESEEQDTRKC